MKKQAERRPKAKHESMSSHSDSEAAALRASMCRGHTLSSEIKNVAGSIPIMILADTCYVPLFLGIKANHLQHT